MTKSGKNGPKQGSSDPELGDLSARLKELSGRIAVERSERAESAKPPASMQDASGYARGYKLVSEFAAGTLVGGLIGYGIDWLFGHFGFHTRPVFLLLFFVLGAAAGIRNVMRAATEINAEIAAKVAAAKDDRET